MVLAVITTSGIQFYDIIIALFIAIFCLRSDRKTIVFVQRKQTWLCTLCDLVWKNKTCFFCIQYRFNLHKKSDLFLFVNRNQPK